MIRTVCQGLALAFLAGEWSREGMLDRGRTVLGGKVSWLPAVVRRLLRHFPAAPGDETAIVTLLRSDSGLHAAIARRAPDCHIRRWLWPESAMSVAQGRPADFAITPLASVGDLAAALDVGPTTLAWLADLRRINTGTKVEALTHYRYRWTPKAQAGYRLIEIPKTRLRDAQRWILRHVLDAIPAAPVAHGFVRGRSVASFVGPHTGQSVVVRLDLEDFFASVGRARIAAIFRRVGYPRNVAAVLAGLCTTATPEHVLAEHPREGIDLARRFLANQRLRDPHLAQGSPTSPALANLAAFRLDIRLAALARGLGATMTRYADDIAISGGRAFDRALPVFFQKAGVIVLEEGFHLNYRKTRVMRQSERQQLCGLVVNAKPNLARREHDRLKAVLWNASRFGLASQNREGRADFRRYLEGRIAWVASINPDRGQRLRALLEKIPRS